MGIGALWMPELPSTSVTRIIPLGGNTLLRSRSASNQLGVWLTTPRDRALRSSAPVPLQHWSRELEPPSPFFKQLP